MEADLIKTFRSELIIALAMNLSREILHLSKGKAKDLKAFGVRKNFLSYIPTSSALWLPEVLLLKGKVTIRTLTNLSVKCGLYRIVNFYDTTLL